MRHMVSKEIPFTEEKQPDHCNPTRYKSKYYGDIAVDNNRNIGNRFYNKKFWLDNFKSLI